MIHLLKKMMLTSTRKRHTQKLAYREHRILNRRFPASAVVRPVGPAVIWEPREPERVHITSRWSGYSFLAGQRRNFWYLPEKSPQLIEITCEREPEPPVEESRN
jgi:hypothetical protein